MKNLFIGVETSCDDTSICVMKRNKIVYEKTISSLELQQLYGGVVPELASREHLKNIHLILNDMLEHINIKKIKCVFCTTTPGLPGSLHIGIFFAKILAKLFNVKFVAINHLYAHIFSAYINSKQKIKFPFLSLVVSGGNTILYLVKDFNQIEILNETVDDAVGEVYDKVGRALGYKYPCGPIIDKLYEETYSHFKFINMPKPEDKLSFSGLKTAILNYINSNKMKNIDINNVLIISSFQKQIINLLVIRLKYYMEKYNIHDICLGGGVSANKLLRLEVSKLTNNVIYPELKYTGDNATMICYYGYLLYKSKKCRRLYV